MRQRADVMKLAVENGIHDLDTIRSAYNEFAEGGKKESWTMKDEADYRAWRSSLPANLRNTNDDDYDMRGAFKADMQPTLESDGYYHLQSRDPRTGRILKAPHHPTYLQAINTDARLGYYPVVDRDGNTYTQTWEGNRYSEGGSIYIKPSHRGRFTRLKERTGHSASWFKAHGTPAQKKMATFELNARKWKHGLGGNLYPDGGYVRENGNPVSFDPVTGDLIDQTTGQIGTLMLPEVKVAARDPRKPVPTTFSKDLNDAIFNISRYLMQYGRNKSGLAPTSIEFNIIDNEPVESMAQATYLTPRNIQKQKFLEAGYTEAPRDYGLVKKAVGDRNIPVYQKRPDEEKRENLIAIGNINTEWFGKDRAELRHAGSYPTAIYINPENSKVYQKAWDLNDYGGNTGTSKAYSPIRKLEANIIDKIGSPVVVTSGISEVDNENIKGSLESVLDDFMYSKGLTRYRDYIKEEIPMNSIHGEPMYNLDGTRVYMTDIKPFTFYGLPEVTVYSNTKKNGHKKQE